MRTKTQGVCSDDARLALGRLKILGAIHSTKISGNFGPKLNGSVRSNRKSFEKTGPPFEVVLFSRSDRSEFWLNESRPCLGRPAGRHAGVVFLIYSQKARMSRIYYLRNRSLLGLFAA